jgi:hypothetical protein
MKSVLLSCNLIIGVPHFRGQYLSMWYSCHVPLIWVTLPTQVQFIGFGFPAVTWSQPSNLLYIFFIYFCIINCHCLITIKRFGFDHLQYSHLSPTALNPGPNLSPSSSPTTTVKRKRDAIDRSTCLYSPSGHRTHI